MAPTKGFGEWGWHITDRDSQKNKKSKRGSLSSHGRSESQPQKPNRNMRMGPTSLV